MLVLGPGLKGEAFEDKVKNSGLEKYFNIVGSVNNPQHFLYNSFCYLSTSRSEGLPLGVLEAMALGLR